MVDKLKKYENYTTIKKFELGQTNVEVCISKIPTEKEIKQYLINIYDVINDIARSCEKRGIDTSSWFYTKEQLEEKKKDPNCIFI